MRVVIGLFILASLTNCLAADIEKEEGVMVLTVDNFDEAIAANTYVLVEFYAPWCGHCKSLAPEYAKAATALADKGSEIALAKVDATVESALGSKYGVNGYPTLKFFKHGKPTEYKGGRTADTIVSWLEKKTGPPAVTLATAEESKKFVEDNKIAVIGFFKDVETDDAKAFLEVADTMDDVKFGITSEDAVFAAHEVEGNKVVLFKKFDEGRNDYDGKYEADELAKFVKANALPILIEFNSETAQKIFSGEIKKHLLLFVKGTSEDFAAQKEMVTKIAKDYKGKVLFVYVDADQKDNKRVLDFFGMKEDEVPAMRMTHMGDAMMKYNPEVSNLDDNDEFDSNIRAFVDGVLEGKIEPHLKSEDIPEDWDKAPVKVLVGKNFADVALNKDKNVLVEFYAPWCGHCKSLAPTWDKLGEKFEGSDDVVIAKMDSTGNEVKDVSVTGFPTIKLFAKGDNKVVDYDGERNEEGFVKFLEKHGSSPPQSDKAETKDEL